MVELSSNKDCAKNNLTLTGHGQVFVPPNIANIRLGVQTTGYYLTDIQTENAQIAQAIIDTLNEMGVTNIKTYQYTIDKVYDYQDGRRIDRGYMVRNILEIRTSELDMVGIIIDAAVNQGANVVDLISFELSEPQVHYQEALNLALLNAYEKAESISITLGLQFNPVPLRIIENAALPISYPQPLFAREGMVPTPIEPGDLKIQAHVTVEFSYL